MIMECYTGDGALAAAKRKITSFINSEDLCICDGVIIENQSQYTLEYVTCGFNTGYPVKDVKNSFKQNPRDPDSYLLPPGAVSAQCWRVNHGGNFGKWVGDVFSLGISASKAMSHVEGYVSMRAVTPGKTYIIPLGFLLGRNRCNKMGIQIRGQDGVLDGRGNIAGHGVDPTGVVTDVVDFCCQVAFASPNDDEMHQTTEQTSTIKVVGKFNNIYLGTHHFIFKDGAAVTLEDLAVED